MKALTKDKWYKLSIWLQPKEDRDEKDFKPEDLIPFIQGSSIMDLTITENLSEDD